jgi:hypothetical protein
MDWPGVNDIGAHAMDLKILPGRRDWRCSVLFGLGIPIVFAAPSALAQTPARPLERVDAFQVAFGLSFRMDACGDSELGDLVRRAVLEKFDHCPFSNGAKAHFHAWAVEENKRQAALFQRYATEHGKLPDRLDGMKESCPELRSSARYQQVRELYEKYGQGKIGVDTIITDPCDVPPVAP